MPASSPEPEGVRPPDEQAAQLDEPAGRLKEKALRDYAEYVNPMKVRTLKSAGLDIIEGRREGAVVWDVTGRRYVDCITGAGSFNTGRRNPRIVEALKRALDETDIGVFLIASKAKADLARRLAEVTPGDLTWTMFGVGGGEANDYAIKLARGFTMKTEIISAVKSYHGHTGFSLSAIGRDAYQKPFLPLMPGFRKVPFGDAQAIEDAITDDTAAVILEPIQGEGGINVPDDDYLPQVRRICDEHGVLLILDEIQTGLGRTGKLWCSEHYGVVPDIMTTAKSLGGSLYPISATVFRQELGDFLITNPFVHLSTFGGSDLGCIVALEVIDYILQNDLPGHAARMGERFRAGFDTLLTQYPSILREVRQKGLMMGLQYTEDSLGPRMSYQLAQHGVIAIFTGNDTSVMRLMPSLVIQPEEVDEVLNALDLSMAAILRQEGGR
ncbi:MAG: aspartate aminotransferase family protein [Bacillota bacterium]